MNAPPTRKPYRITKQREKWTEEEHQRFLDAVAKCGLIPESHSTHPCMTATSADPHACCILQVWPQLEGDCGPCWHQERCTGENGCLLCAASME